MWGLCCYDIDAWLLGYCDYYRKERKKYHNHRDKQIYLCSYRWNRPGPNKSSRAQSMLLNRQVVYGAFTHIICILVHLLIYSSFRNSTLTSCSKLRRLATSNMIFQIICIFKWTTPVEKTKINMSSHFVPS